MYPPGTRPGVAAVDAVIAALEASDVPALLKLVDFGSLPCKSELTQGSPDCPSGAADDTSTQSVIFGSCESGERSDEFVARMLRRSLAEGIHLYGVYSGLAYDGRQQKAVQQTVVPLRHHSG